MTDLEAVLRAFIRSLVDEAMRAAAPPPPEYIGVTTYARMWSISPNTVRRAIADKRLAAQRVGRAVRVRADARIERPNVATAAERALNRAKLAMITGGKR
jgi:excisionase family DNA binding protein